MARRFGMSCGCMPLQSETALTAGANKMRQERTIQATIFEVFAQHEIGSLDGEIVPASEKLVSLFEPHADIIVKGGRQVQYGHKLNLATGKSGLILDIVIETGNPADAERFLPMLDRHIARTGAP